MLNTLFFDKILLHTKSKNSIKNKKYTISLLNRCMLHSLLNTDELKYNHYIRILGINHQGIAYLNTLPKNCKTFIFASPKEKGGKLYAKIENGGR